MNIQYKPIDLIQEIQKNNYSYTHTFTKKLTVADEKVEKLQDKAERFKKSVKKLKRYSSGAISRDLLESQVDDLLKSYNDMKNSSGEVADKDVQKQLSKLDKLFSDNENSLKKIGVETVNGRYVLDSKTFSEVSDKTLSTLFEGHDSFIGKVDKILRKVDETASDAPYSINEFPVSQTHKYEQADMTLAALMTLAGQTTAALQSCNDLVQSGQISDIDVQNSVKKLLAYFAQSAYRTDSANESPNIDRLNQLCLSQRDKLADLGMTFDSQQKEMTFHAGIDMTTPDFQNAYNELFGKNAAFGNAVIGYSKNVFNDIIQPDQIGVSIIDTQA